MSTSLSFCQLLRKSQNLVNVAGKRNLNVHKYLSMRLCNGNVLQIRNVGIAKSIQETRSVATEAAQKGLHLTFASPNKSFFDNQIVKQVDAPSYSGSLGILENHVPILAVLKPGVVTVHKEDGSTEKVFVAAGTLTMNEDSSLLILASEAVNVEDLDASEAQKNLAAASSQSTPEAKIQVEVNEAIIEAAK